MSAITLLNVLVTNSQDSVPLVLIFPKDFLHSRYLPCVYALTRPSTRSTSAPVLLEVAPTRIIPAPMKGRKADTEAYLSGYPARNFHGVVLRCVLNFLQCCHQRQSSSPKWSR